MRCTSLNPPDMYICGISLAMDNCTNNLKVIHSFVASVQKSTITIVHWILISFEFATPSAMFFTGGSQTHFLMTS